MSTLRHYLHVLWRRKWLGLAPLVLIPLLVIVATARQESVHEASADVLVNRQEVATTSLIGETPAFDNADRTMQTQIVLARVPAVIERAVAAAGETSASSNGLLRARSSVSSVADILRFTVSDSDPARAVRNATAYARAFVEYRTELDTAGLARTLDGLRTRLRELEAAGRVESPLYATLADREQQLESIRALRASNVSVVRTADLGDTTQVAPRPRRNTAVALAAGLVVGLLLVFLAESLSTRPRSKEEFEALLGMPYLARLTFPDTDADPVLEGLSGREADAVHTLRVALELQSPAAGPRTIMVTGSRSGDPSSATAAELAVAFARAGRRVALVDLDLRDRSLSRLAGVEDRIGVTTLVRGECELSEALVSIALEGEPEGGAPANSNGRRDHVVLDVLGSGPPTENPADVVSSTHVARMLAELERRADVVLVAVPPLLDAPDAAAVATSVDGLLLTVSSRDARGPTLAEARRVLETWPVARLGFVLTEGSAGRSYGVRRVTRWSKRPAPEPERVA